jgi:hypothetical protein
MKKIISNRIYSVKLIIIIALAGAVLGCGKRRDAIDLNATGYDADSEKDRVRYWIGTLNGVKLQIPDYYLFPKKIVYEGERHDGLGPASEGATSDSRIVNFGLLLRTSNLQPIRTEQDRLDWLHAQYVWADSSWMMVDFDNIYPIDRTQSPRHYMLPEYGPFDRDDNLSYGLTHYESEQPISQGEHDSRVYGHVEYFFDLGNLTRIECDTIQTKTKPLRVFTTCDHRFFIPELNVMAEAFYSKRDLYRWREIETRVREIVHTFAANPVAR